MLRRRRNEPAVQQSVLSPACALSTELTEGERRLAAIMFTDIVGYTALAQANEARALAALEGKRVLLRSLFPKFNGREVKTIVYFKKIAEENPDFPVVYPSLCQAYLRKSMFKEAMEAVERYCGS